MPVQRENTNKVLRALAKSRSDRDRLVVSTGLSPTEVAAAIHELKKLSYVQVDNNEFALTPTGKDAVPPGYVLDLSKHDPKQKGYKHVHGVAGKFDYSRPLRGGLALLYDALTRPMDANQWSIAANMEINSAWAYIGRLEDFGIVTATEELNPKSGKKHKIYCRARNMKTQDDVIVEAPETPVPEPTAVVSNFSTPNPSLDDALDELQQRYSVFEIVLTAMAKLEPEYKSLTDFRDRVQSTFGEILK